MVSNATSTLLRIAALGLLSVPLTATAEAPTPTPASPAPATPATPATKSSCTATTRGKFHLRPKAQVKSAGPEFAKGTTLIVLAQLPPPEKKDARPIYQVQVKGGALGYAYLRRSELGATCPIIWPGSETLSSGTPVNAEGTCLLAGPQKSAKALYSKKCDEKGPRKEDKQLDVNGDGRIDWVVVAKGEGEDHELAVLLNTPAGFRTLRLDTGSAKLWDFEGAVPAGPAVYMIRSMSEWENITGDDGELEQEGNTSVSIYRVFPDGSAYHVFEHGTDYNSEGCSFTGRADESLLMSCGKSQQRLRWDAAAKVLRPTLETR